MGWSVNARDGMLGQARGRITHLSIHTGDPGRRIYGLPVGSYEVTVQDRTVLATSLASPRHPFEVVP